MSTKFRKQCNGLVKAITRLQKHRDEAPDNPDAAYEFLRNDNAWDKLQKAVEDAENMDEEDEEDDCGGSSE